MAHAEDFVNVDIEQISAESCRKHPTSRKLVAMSPDLHYLSAAFYSVPMRCSHKQWQQSDEILYAFPHFIHLQTKRQIKNS